MSRLSVCDRPERPGRLRRPGARGAPPRARIALPRPRPMGVSPFPPDPASPAASPPRRASLPRRSFLRRRLRPRENAAALLRGARTPALALSALAALVLAAPEKTEAQTEVAEVYENWSLKPSGVNVGERFRLLFVTSTKKNASTTLIGAYNGIIQRAATAGHTDIRAYRSSFRVLGSTATVDARDNTSTTYTASDTGVPIYYLKGEKVADNYQDFYDGTWDSHSPTNEFGTSSSANIVWTGSNSNGTKHSEPLGNRSPTDPYTRSLVQIGGPTSTVADFVLTKTDRPFMQYFGQFWQRGSRTSPPIPELCCPTQPRMEVLHATASECTCDVAPNQETATKVHYPSAGACADASWPCRVS